MSGIKGRSGKLTTAEQKASASERGKLGMAKRWGKTNIPPTPTGIDPSSDDPVLRLGRPVTWGDELKRQQVEGERIQNRRRQVEVDRAAVELARAQDERDTARGKLLPADEARAAMRDLAAVLLSHVPVIVDAALALVPVEAQPTARLKLDAAVAEFRRRAEAEAAK
jgi:hypothetical protein